MRITCPECQTEYNLDAGRLGGGSARVQCSNCSHVFYVGPEASAVAEPSEADGTSFGLPPGSQNLEEVADRELLLRQGGRVYKVRNLATFQRWIVERRVLAGDEFSLDGASWELASLRPELRAFFEVLENLRDVRSELREVYMSQSGVEDEEPTKQMDKMDAPVSSRPGGPVFRPPDPMTVEERERSETQIDEALKKISAFHRPVQPNEPVPADPIASLDIADVSPQVRTVEERGEVFDGHFDISFPDDSLPDDDLDDFLGRSGKKSPLRYAFAGLVLLGIAVLILRGGGEGDEGLDEASDPTSQSDATPAEPTVDPEEPQEETTPEVVTEDEADGEAERVVSPPPVSTARRTPPPRTTRATEARPSRPTSPPAEATSRASAPTPRTPNPPAPTPAPERSPAPPPARADVTPPPASPPVAPVVVTPPSGSSLWSTPSPVVEAPAAEEASAEEAGMSVAALLDSARQAYNRGDYRDAIRLANQVIERDPVNLSAWVRTGWSHIEVGNYPLAMASFKRAISLQERNAEAHYGLGLAYDGLGRAQEALQSLRRAVEISPSSADAVEIRAVIRGIEGN